MPQLSCVCPHVRRLHDTRVAKHCRGADRGGSERQGARELLRPLQAAPGRVHPRNTGEVDKDVNSRSWTSCSASAMRLASVVRSGPRYRQRTGLRSRVRLRSTISACARTPAAARTTRESYMTRSDRAPQACGPASRRCAGLRRSSLPAMPPQSRHDTASWAQRPAPLRKRRGPAACNTWVQSCLTPRRVARACSPSRAHARSTIPCSP